MAIEAKAEVSELEDKVLEKSDAQEAAPKTEGEPKDLKGKGIVLFVRQIISELKKVVSPTPTELKEYSIVVLVFVLVIMLFITGVDVAIGQGVMWLFANN